MKKIFFSVLVFSAFFSNTNAQGRSPVGNDWQLTYDQAIGMLGRLNNCTSTLPCYNNTNVIDLDNDEYRWIVSHYPGAIISLVDARYRSTDENRYKTLRGITEAGRSTVRGYKTKLVKVELSSTGKLFGTTILYFDCFTVCPPPSDGTCPNTAGL